MHKAGNYVVGILGARNKDLLIMVEEMQHACDSVRVVTDDGSCGDKGLVTDAIRAEVAANGQPDLCVAIGPLIMMRETAKVTAQLKIKTLVSLNPVMVDGTGMCGGCRVTVSGESKFVCVDGPEFDGHGVDFDELMRRQRFYQPQERGTYEAFLKEHGHDPKDCNLRRLEAAVREKEAT